MDDNTQQSDDLDARIADAIAAALEPLTSTVSQIQAAQADYAKKTNRELKRVRLKSKGVSVDQDDDDPEPDPSDDMESMLELIRAELSMEPEQRDYLKSKSEGLSINDRLRLYRAVTDMPTPSSGEKPSTKPPATRSRGQAPNNQPSNTVKPKTQMEYFALPKEQRTLLDRDPEFHPEDLPRS